MLERSRRKVSRNEPNALRWRANGSIMAVIMLLARHLVAFPQTLATNAGSKRSVPTALVTMSGKPLARGRRAAIAKNAASGTSALAWARNGTPAYRVDEADAGTRSTETVRCSNARDAPRSRPIAIASERFSLLHFLLDIRYSGVFSSFGQDPANGYAVRLFGSIGIVFDRKDRFEFLIIHDQRDQVLATWHGTAAPHTR